MQALRRLLAAIVAHIGVVAGVWYVASYAVGYIVLTPAYLADPDDVRGFFDDFTTVKFGSWALLLSIVGLVWFLAGLSEDLHEMGEARLGRVAMGGGIVGATATVGGAAAFWIGTSRLEEAGTAAAAVADLTTIHDLATTLLLVAAPIGFGVTALAVAAAGARSARVPPAVTLVFAGLAIALWVPWISRFVIGLWLVWVMLIVVVVQRHWTGEAVRPTA